MPQSSEKSRRRFLARGAGAAAVLFAGPAAAFAADWRAKAFPFALGVASGDPLPDGFVLWTRLCADPLRADSLPPEAIPVAWEVAEDEALKRIVKRGQAVATPELAHTLHVEVSGLRPSRDYFYRFIAGGERSGIGRSRTAPAPGASPKLNLGVVSCQHYETGFYTAYRHLTSEALDVVVHLGDYIYEGASATSVRKHEALEPMTLDAYRARYATYKMDLDLQAAHARFPFIATWDDHEVDNNYAGAIAEDQAPQDAFLKRRAAAYQAYYEHLPLRKSALPLGPDATLYRRIRYGQTAELFVLDTRQYRSDQPCGDGRKPRCAENLDPRAAMLGEAQERWLFESLRGSQPRWPLIANQVAFAQLDSQPGPESIYPMDKWDGYPVARQRVLDFLRQTKLAPVVLTGDMHVNMAADLLADFDDPRSACVGSELLGTSISSGGDGQDLPPWAAAILEANAHVRFFNTQRGYLRLLVTPDRVSADYRVVPFVTRPDAPIATRASFVIERERPGLQKA